MVNGFLPKYEVGGDGRTGYERMKRKPCSHGILDSGENPRSVPGVAEIVQVCSNHGRIGPTSVELTRFGRIRVSIGPSGTKVRLTRNLQIVAKRPNLAKPQTKSGRVDHVQHVFARERAITTKRGPTTTDDDDWARDGEADFGVLDSVSDAGREEIQNGRTERGGFSVASPTTNWSTSFRSGHLLATYFGTGLLPSQKYVYFGAICRPIRKFQRMFRGLAWAATSQGRVEER